MVPGWYNVPVIYFAEIWTLHGASSSTTATDPFTNLPETSPSVSAVQEVSCLVFWHDSRLVRFEGRLCCPKLSGYYLQEWEVFVLSWAWAPWGLMESLQRVFRAVDVGWICLQYVVAISF